MNNKDDAHAKSSDDEISQSSLGDNDDDILVLGLGKVDLTTVNFDEEDTNEQDDGNVVLTRQDELALEIEYKFLMTGDKSVFDSLLQQQQVEGEGDHRSDNDDPSLVRIGQLGKNLILGNYVEALRGETANWFSLLQQDDDQTGKGKDLNGELEATTTSVWDRIRLKLGTKVQSVTHCVELELLAVAALNLFLQLNYTGPLLEDPETALSDINPHSCFARALQHHKDYTSPKDQTDLDSDDEEKKKQESITSKRDTKYHNAVLSELAVDGVFPCHVAEGPYYLLLARCILLSLSHPEDFAGWMPDFNTPVQGRHPRLDGPKSRLPTKFTNLCAKLNAVHVWNARAIVTHERLLLSGHQEPTQTLWNQVQRAMENSLNHVDSKLSTTGNQQQNNYQLKQLHANILLEYGLAHYHWNRPGKGKKIFQQAIEASGLSVEVTGAEGKRTKFQRKATAQMVVRATSSSIATTTPAKSANGDSSDAVEDRNSVVESQQVALSEDTILLDRVKFENDKENEISRLTILDQAILLALCLDVKNTNPADGLTGEQMGAYLARVLCHADDWMVYSTALLERAWVEFEGNHTKERSILQMQALADQHTNRLTITQSTRKSVEESSPVQDRLKHLHMIVYPPRWHMLRDVADRYAHLGIVTSAAELYTEIEYWDAVVECYRRAGKESKAEEIVRERLAIAETPRMWAALGDITNDPNHYEKAIELSKGRFSYAYVALGHYYFEKQDLKKAAEKYRQSLKLRPLAPAIWFRLGTISMQLEDWNAALVDFSEVVQQQPEESEAWANVAAIHLRNKRPAEAYPALQEVQDHKMKKGKGNTEYLLIEDLHFYLLFSLSPFLSVIETKSQQLESLGEQTLHVPRFAKIR